MRTPSRSKIDVATPDGVAELEALVNDRLSGQLANLEIVITADGIVLRGCTHTYHAQQLAAEVVEQLVTVPIAANEIEVLQGSERIPAFPMRPRAASCAHDGD